MTTTLTKKQSYISKGPNQQLWIEQPRDLRDENGRKYGQTDLKAVIFEDHRYEATEEKAEKLGFTFDELIAFIEGQPTMNVDIWLESAPPDEQSPTLKEQTEKIFAAVVKLDPDAIGKLMEDERATHNRQSVLQVASAALEQLQSEGEPEKS